MLGIIAALVLEQVDTRVRDPEDAQRVAATGVLGIIPELRGAANRPLALTTDEQGLGAEAFRKLRTNLRFVRAERPRAIAVTSPSPGACAVTRPLASTATRSGSALAHIVARLGKSLP